jgi:hypothetical protein
MKVALMPKTREEEQKADEKEEMMIASNKCEFSYRFMFPQQIIENGFAFSPFFFFGVKHKNASLVFRLLDSFC